MPFGELGSFRGPADVDESEAVELHECVARARVERTPRKFLDRLDEPFIATGVEVELSGLVSEARRPVPQAEVFAAAGHAGGQVGAQPGETGRLVVADQVVA